MYIEFCYQKTSLPRAFRFSLLSNRNLSVDPSVVWTSSVPVGPSSASAAQRPLPPSPHDSRLSAENNNNNNNDDSNCITDSDGRIIKRFSGSTSTSNNDNDTNKYDRHHGDKDDVKNDDFLDYAEILDLHEEAKETESVDEEVEEEEAEEEEQNEKETISTDSEMELPVIYDIPPNHQHMEPSEHHVAQSQPNIVPFEPNMVPS